MEHAVDLTTDGHPAVRRSLVIAGLARRVAAAVTGTPLTLATDLAGLATEATTALAVMARRGLGRAWGL